MQFRLYVVLNDQVISESNMQILNCPVQPHNGKMLPLDEVNNGRKLTYQGDPDAGENGEYWGRMFHQIAGYDGYFFRYLSSLETDNAKRGFDCITYAGAACGASIHRMKASADLAASLDATACSVETSVEKPGTKGAPPTVTKATAALENAELKYVKEFFRTNTTGYFLMWSTGHIVLVGNGVVHEFTPKAGISGYAATPVQTWLETTKAKKLTVRKLPKKPALAT